MWSVTFQRNNCLLNVRMMSKQHFCLLDSASLGWNACLMQVYIRICMQIHFLQPNVNYEMKNRIMDVYPSLHIDLYGVVSQTNFFLYWPTCSYDQLPA